MNIPKEAIVAFQGAWEAKRKEIGRGVAPSGTKTRAGLEAALPEIEAALRTQIAADIRDHAELNYDWPGQWRIGMVDAARIAEEGTFE